MYISDCSPIFLRSNQIHFDLNICLHTTGVEPAFSGPD
jgi:hypothetical protein